MSEMSTHNQNEQPVATLCVLLLSVTLVLSFFTCSCFQIIHSSTWNIIDKFLPKYLVLFDLKYKCLWQERKSISISAMRFIQSILTKYQTIQQSPLDYFAFILCHFPTVEYNSDPFPPPPPKFSHFKSLNYYFVCSNTIN